MLNAANPESHCAAAQAEKIESHAKPQRRKVAISNFLAPLRLRVRMTSDGVQANPIEAISNAQS